MVVWYQRNIHSGRPHFVCLSNCIQHEAWTQWDLGNSSQILIKHVMKMTARVRDLARKI